MSRETGPAQPVTYPILHQTGAYGEVEEWEDHIRIFGAMEPKRLWLRDHGRFPWLDE